MLKSLKKIVHCPLSIVHWKMGQSMIEVVVAMGVIVLLAVALVTTSIVTQKASRGAKLNTQATKLSQQAIEQVRVYRDRKGYEALQPGDCFIILNTVNPDPVNWQLNPCPNSDGEEIPVDNVKFYRAIKIEGGDPKNITVTVEWDDSGGRQQIIDQTILSSGLER